MEQPVENSMDNASLLSDSTRNSLSYKTIPNEESMLCEDDCSNIINNNFSKNSSVISSIIISSYYSVIYLFR
jgi:hypothetical protein